MPDNKSTSSISPSAFGRLIRFWRTTMGLSQAQLAELVEAAPRHISFLETGRSNPTREMIQRLAEVLSLGERDIGTLLIAAGFVHEPAPLDLNAAENRPLKDSLSMMLAKHDPYPALVINSIGDIIMCNRGWLTLMHFAQLDDRLTSSMVNLMDLYFSDAGLRQHIANWEELACFLLLKIKEQQFLTNSPKLAELAEWLEAYPGLPTKWAKRARDARQVSHYDIHYQTPQMNEAFASRTLVTGIEPERHRVTSEWQLHSFLPLNNATASLWQQFPIHRIKEHPLLFPITLT